MWTGRLGTWWSSLRTTRMSSSRFLREKKTFHSPSTKITYIFLFFSAFPRIAKWSTSSSVGTSSSRWEARRATSSSIRSSSTSSLGDGLEMSHHHQLELLDQLFHRLTGGWTRTLSSWPPLVIVGRLDHLCNFGFLDISYQIFWAWLTWPTAWSPVWSWDLKRKHGLRHVLQQLHQHQRWTCLRQIESLWYTNMCNLTLPSFNQSQTLTS